MPSVQTHNAPAYTKFQNSQRCMALAILHIFAARFSTGRRFCGPRLSSHRWLDRTVPSKNNT